MFNISSTEIAFIAVIALLVLGPKKLPELARNIGKLMREFRQRTDEVRNVVEREFYKMDDELNGKGPAPLPKAAPYAISQGQPEEPNHDGSHDAHDPDEAYDGSKDPQHDEMPPLPAGDAMHSQVTAGMPPGESAPASPEAVAQRPSPSEPAEAPAAEPAPQKS